MAMQRTREVKSWFVVEALKSDGWTMASKRFSSFEQAENMIQQFIKNKPNISFRIIRCESDGGAR